VETTVEIKDGTIIEEGVWLPAALIIDITVAGKIWIEVAFMTKNIIIFFVAVELPLYIAFTALMPAGVAAPPIPSIFDAKLTAI
jgi:hypothetical protein